MPSALIRKVADYCWSHNFLDVFHKYFADHADSFIGAPEICGGEHNMEYYSLFQKYLGVYEETLTKFVTSIDCSIEEFYAEVREAQDESVDPYLRVFIDCLLASADYESFYKVMVREGKKKALALKRAENVKAAESIAAAKPIPSEDKADGKGIDAADSDIKLDVAESKSESKELEHVDVKMSEMDSKLGGGDSK